MGKMKKYRMLRLMDDTPKALIHEAKNMKKDERVMIKELKKKYYTQEDCNSNREVQTINKLKQENILKMLEMFNDDTELLMVFEYMPETVKSVMKKRMSPFTEDEAKCIMVQVMSGVAYMHKQGYIHCNLRPDILVCNEDATVVKISDFSSVKSLREAPFSDLNVQPLWYTAPECIMGSERYSTPIDIWSIGCIMAELLTSKVLLRGDSNQTQIQKTCELIGTFTRSEWPEGMGLQLMLNYKLPQIDKPAELFANMGLEAGSDAKEFILSMLKWSPQKRKTAEELLRDRFLAGANYGSTNYGDTNNDDMYYGDTHNGGGGGSNYQQVSDIGRLETWRSRWQNNMTTGSLEELDQIINEMTSPRHPQTNGQHAGHQYGSSNQQGMDHDYFGMGNRPNQFNQPENSDMQNRRFEQARNSYDTQRNGFEDNRNTLEEEVIVRQEKRGGKGIATDLMFPEDFGATPRNGNNANQGQTTGRQDDTMQQTARGCNPLQMSRPERLKAQLPVKYNTVYGKELRYVLGGKDENGKAETDIYGNPIPKSGSKNGGRGQNAGGKSPPTFIDELRANSRGKQANNLDEKRLRYQDDIFDNNTESKQNDNGQQRRDKPLNDIPFKDHEKAARALYRKNKNKYEDRYGKPDVRAAIGIKPPGSMKFPDEESDRGKTSRSRADDFHYTPTWAENGRAGRGTRN